VNTNFSVVASSASTFNLTVFNSPPVTKIINIGENNDHCAYLACLRTVSISQSLVSSWSSNGQNNSQWNVVIHTTTLPLYEVVLGLIPRAISSAIYNYWSINPSSTGTPDYYTIPSYEYNEGVLLPSSTVSFGYQINSFSAVDVVFENNACLLPPLNCSVHLSQSIQTSYDTGSQYFVQYQFIITNYGVHVANYAYVRVDAISSITVTALYNMDSTSDPNIFRVPLFHLYPGSTDASAGYKVMIPSVNKTSFVTPTITISSMTCIVPTN